MPTRSDHAPSTAARPAGGSGAAPGSKSRLTTWAELLLVAPALVLAGIVPHRIGLGLSAALGKIVYRAHATWRKVALINLEIAFPGELGFRRARSIAESAFVSFYQTVFELVHFLNRSPAAILARSDCQGFESFSAAASKGRGVIVCSVHLANWYWPAMYAASLGIPERVVVQPLENRLLDRWMVRLMRRRGLTTVTRRGLALRAVVAALRRGEIVGLMVDQNAATGGRFVPFFGTPASTMRGVAYLRKLTRCEVLCVHDVRARGRHTVVVSEPMELPDDELAALRRINQHFEELIRLQPERYFWMQARWKARPDGEATLYPGLAV